MLFAAGKKHKTNKEKLDRLEVMVTCNSNFGSKRPAVEDLSGSVYCGICNTTLMASKENMESHFQGSIPKICKTEKSQSEITCKKITASLTASLWALWWQIVVRWTQNFEKKKSVVEMYRFRLQITGKKHQARLAEKTAVERPKPANAPAPINVTPKMMDIAKSVVGKISADDVGTHESGVYCKVCRTILTATKIWPRSQKL